MDNDPHYSDCVEHVRRLKREGRLDEAEVILLAAVDATERESADRGCNWGVAPWYYEQLAIIYRKQRRYAAEVDVLQRYRFQPRGPGAGPAKLALRLDTARALELRSQRL